MVIWLPGGAVCASRNFTFGPVYSAMAVVAVASNARAEANIMVFFILSPNRYDKETPGWLGFVSSGAVAPLRSSNCCQTGTFCSIFMIFVGILPAGPLKSKIYTKNQNKTFLLRKFVHAAMLRPDASHRGSHSYCLSSLKRTLAVKAE